jgi:cytochrome c
MKTLLISFLLFVLAAASLPAAKPDPATEALMKKSDCFTCHNVKVKVVGPAFIEVAKKYRGKKGIVTVLAKKVQTGGSGNWGPVAMAAHPDLKDADAKAMVTWVLAQK